MMMVTVMAEGLHLCEGYGIGTTRVKLIYTVQP